MTSRPLGNIQIKWTSKRVVRVAVYTTANALATSIVDRPVHACSQKRDVGFPTKWSAEMTAKA